MDQRLGNEIGHISQKTVVRWKDRVKEYMHDKGADGKRGLKQARRKYMDRERWRFFYHGHPLRKRIWRKSGVREKSKKIRKIKHIYIYICQGPPLVCIALIGQLSRSM